MPATNSFKKLFNLLAPEFSDLGANDLNCLYDEFIKSVPLDPWGDKQERALVYLVAHALTMSQRGGRVGGVTSETVGSLSRSYGGLSTIEDELDLTSYGVAFKRCRRELVITPIIVC